MTQRVAIIGAGVAGLCAGIYAQMNGYQTTLYESHSLPGGLCTAWKRDGYTIDGCIHWLVGSGEGVTLYKLWQEVGLVQNREFVYPERFAVYEGADGRTLTLWADPDRLEQEMLSLAPQDKAAIQAFTDGIRAALGFNPPENADPATMRFLDFIKLIPILPKLSKVRKLVGLPMSAFAARFTDPLLATAVREMWPTEMSAYFMFQTLAWLHKKQAGYPIGGSLPLAKTLAKRYEKLGGTIRYNAPVEAILTEGESPAKAVGVRVGGAEKRYDAVISAADGRATIFDLLGGRYVDDTIRATYDHWKIFPPIMIVALGVARAFDDEPVSVMGTSLELPEPLAAGGNTTRTLNVSKINIDPTLNPPGHTTLTVYIESPYDHWKALAADPAAYEAEKQAAAESVIARLDRRWPGLRQQVEMCDVATPLTFERYTGNWQGTYEGWLATPENAMLQMKQTLPGLENFWMAGQWVSPGGGLPSGVASARSAVQALCKADGKRFLALPPQ